MPWFPMTPTPSPITRNQLAEQLRAAASRLEASSPVPQSPSRAGRFSEPLRTTLGLQLSPKGETSPFFARSSKPLKLV